MIDKDLNKNSDLKNKLISPEPKTDNNLRTDIVVQIPATPFRDLK